MSQQPTSQSLARDACIVAAARIARERGFAAADEGALEALADVVRASVRALARRAAANARHATRSELALNDVLSALKQSPSNRVAWQELRDFFFPREGHGWRLPAQPGSTLPAPKRSSRYGVLGAGATTTRRAHVPAFLPPFPEKVLEKEAPAKKRKRGAEDDARDAEALQLALNRIASPPPREDGGALPLQERLDRAKASA